MDVEFHVYVAGLKSKNALHGGEPGEYGRCYLPVLFLLDERLIRDDLHAVVRAGDVLRGLDLCDAESRGEAQLTRQTSDVILVAAYLRSIAAGATKPFSPLAKSGRNKPALDWRE